MTDQVNISVSEGQKQRWEDHVKKSQEFRTLSAFVRTAVVKELNGDQNSDSQEDLIEPALFNDIQGIKSEVEQIRRDVSWIREKEQQKEDISDLANEVFATLETLPTNLQKETHGALSVIDVSGPQTISEISKKVDAHPNEVEDAIDYLYDNFHPITSKTIDNEVHWFKED